MECLICFEPITEDQPISRTCCSIFHTQCLHQWYIVSLSCPICRKKVDQALVIICYKHCKCNRSLFLSIVYSSLLFSIILTMWKFFY